MDALAPADGRGISAGKLATARTRRARNRPLACGMRSAPLSAVRASRCLRSLTRWPSFLAPNYSTHVPSNFRRNSHKTNDWCTRQVQLKWGCARRSCPDAERGRFRKEGASLTAESCQITRHTMQSNFHSISLKTNDGCTHKVTHFFMVGLPVSTPDRAPEATASGARDMKRAWEIGQRGARFVGRGFNPAISNAAASLPFAPLHPREPSASCRFSFPNRQPEGRGLGPHRPTKPHFPPAKMITIARLISQARPPRLRADDLGALSTRSSRSPAYEPEQQR